MQLLTTPNAHGTIFLVYDKRDGGHYDIAVPTGWAWMFHGVAVQTQQFYDRRLGTKVDPT